MATPVPFPRPCGVDERSLRSYVRPDDQDLPSYVPMAPQPRQLGKYLMGTCDFEGLDHLDRHSWLEEWRLSKPGDWAWRLPGSPWCLLWICTACQSPRKAGWEFDDILHGGKETTNELEGMPCFSFTYPRFTDHLSSDSSRTLKE